MMASLTGAQVAAIIVAPILVVLILGTGILLFVFKQRRTRENVGNAKDTDENPTYGDYYEPNPTSEVEDNNIYYSLDYEAGTERSRIKDNNPLYL